jgi:predicted small metal-binding protein
METGMSQRPMRLRCACGWETSGSEDDVIAAAIEHGARVHNMRPTREEVLSMVVTDPISDRADGST